jgi:hypothetical protein
MRNDNDSCSEGIRLNEFSFDDKPIRRYALCYKSPYERRVMRPFVMRRRSVRDSLPLASPRLYAEAQSDFVATSSMSLQCLCVSLVCTQEQVLESGTVHVFILFTRFTL